jgi:hypothetical protein
MKESNEGADADDQEAGVSTVAKARSSMIARP